MSTVVVTASELQNTLLDYRIHLTGEISSTQSGNCGDQTRAVENPQDWPTDRRRVPVYRPVDRNRDVEGRPNGSNPIERGFLTIMFTGVVLNATAAKVWGATGGPYFPQLFKYAIGGEW